VISKLLKAFSIMWCVIVLLIMTTCLISIWYADGFFEVCRIYSPLNSANAIVSLVILSPGIAAHRLSERLT